MKQCKNCAKLESQLEKQRAYGFGLRKLNERLHRRAQAAEGALNTYIKALQETGGIHGSLYQPKIEARFLERTLSDPEDVG